MTSPVIQIQGLRKSFGAHPVLDGLDWTIPEGRVVGLLGRNGAGKSTLFETLLGLRQADAGEMRVFGESPAKLSDATRAKIGYVPQSAELFGWLTPRNMLDYFASFYPQWNHGRVNGLLSRWGFDGIAEQTIASLSPGQKQRLSIIRALAHDPQLLILDEPVAALDPGGRRDFLRELVDIVAYQAVTVVFSTHILSDLERVAVDCAFLAHGKIVLQAPLDQLQERVLRVSVTREAMPELAALGVRFFGAAPATREDACHALAWFGELDPQSLRERFIDVAVVPPALEDVFIEVTQ